MSGIVDHPSAQYPAWLGAAGKPLVPITVIVGPSGNGAKALALARAESGHVVYDKNDVITELSGMPWPQAPEFIRPALQRRNAFLASLATPAGVAGIRHVWLIEHSPEAWQRRFWSERLGAQILLVDPGRDRALVAAAAEGVEAKWVHRWYADAAKGAGRPAVAIAAAEPSNRGYDGRHRKMRDKQLAKQPLCQMCLEVGRSTPATVLDHIKPYRRPDKSIDHKLWGDPKNHRSLCEDCHNANGAQRARPEKPPGAGVDGRPLDPAHPWNKNRD